MNQDSITGHANDLTGKVKETAGSVTGDRSLQAGGIVDQVKGAIQKTIGGAAGDNTPGVGGSVNGAVNGTVDKARQFAKDRPWAAAAAAGVIGLAILNTLRGKGRA
jgi:uncharacterized protein YjbJ (UPF0337 family)